MSFFNNPFCGRFIAVSLICLASVCSGFAQPVDPTPSFRSQEVSEVDGYPVVMKNLPNWDNVRSQAKFAATEEELRAIVGDRSFISAIDMVAGTEAAFAEYSAGKLLLVEFTSPQSSVDADERIKAAIASEGSVAYRRIGNYNVIVFDAADLVAAEALLDEVKYEKQIQWLGDNPFRITEEQAFVMTTRDIFIATVTVILGGFGIAILGGLLVGFVYFGLRERRRRSITAYSDAGGMTRLNLDDLSSDL